jgi:Ser/Thr protein kinase RdoA (MazF antagonist)
MDHKELLSTVESFRNNCLDKNISFSETSRFTTPYSGSEVRFGTLDSGRRVVVKVSARKLGAEREWGGLVRTFEAGLSVPEPIALVNTQIGHPALVTEQMEGKLMYYTSQNELRYRLGQMVKRMHDAVPVDSRRWVEAGKSDLTYYESRLHHWWIANAEVLGVKTDSQALFKKLVPMMATYCNSVVPRFNHNDLHDGQVIVVGENITIIDFEDWIEESPMNDLAYYLYSTIRTGTIDEQFGYFLDGYLETEILSEVEKGALMFYLLYISCRSVNQFKLRRVGLAEIALSTHQKVVKYIKRERLWKNP